MILHRQTRPERFERRSAFTLLEVLIVLSIIALIAALVGPRLFGQFDRSKVTAAAVQVKSLKSALDTMQLDIGRYPTEKERAGGGGTVTRHAGVRRGAGGMRRTVRMSRMN